MPIDLFLNNDYGTYQDTVTVNIYANHFQDIIAFQSSLNWDPAILNFVGVSDFGIKDFDEENFGLSDILKGHLRFLWQPEDAEAISLPDSTIIFSAHFEVKSEVPKSTVIDFNDKVSNPPFSNEFYNDQLDQVEQIDQARSWRPAG